METSGTFQSDLIEEVKRLNKENVGGLLSGATPLFMESLQDFSEPLIKFLAMQLDIDGVKSTMTLEQAADMVFEKFSKTMLFIFIG